LVYAAALDGNLNDLLNDTGAIVFYLVVWGLVFVGTGLFVGAFIPFITGDSLLFAAGIIAATSNSVDVQVLVTGVGLAAFIGDQVGFILGRHYGRPYLTRRGGPKIQAAIAKTESFYEKYGWWSVVIARYIPWVRTFVPPIAGTVRMNYYKFLSANALGAFLWGVGITLAGFYSGSISWVRDISYFLAAFFITGSIISAIINYRRDRRV